MPGSRPTATGVQGQPIKQTVLTPKSQRQNYVSPSIEGAVYASCNPRPRQGGHAELGPSEPRLHGSGPKRKLACPGFRFRPRMVAVGGSPRQCISCIASYLGGSNAK